MTGNAEVIESNGERVEFTCIDCGGHVEREPGQFDVDGLTPARCALCTLVRMKE